MTSLDLLNALDDCIDRLATGHSVEDCLRSYPQHAAALRPMLESGLVVRGARYHAIEVVQAQDRVRFRLAQHRRRSRLSTLRLIQVSASLLILIIIVLGGLGLAAARSLPGETLYKVKRLAESVRLYVSGDSPALRQEFAQRRLEEVMQLLALRRSADVEFSGELQAVQDSNWRVADVPVRVTAATDGIQSVQIGDVIEVHGLTTGQGDVFAQQVLVLTRGDPAVNPVPTATATTTPTHTPSATTTPIATVIRTPTARSVQPAATSAPQVAPTVRTDNSGSGSRDNDNDGSDDNSGPGGGSDDSGSGGSGSGKD